MQQRGVWAGALGVPADWIALATQARSAVTRRAYDGYGYSWRLNSDRDGPFVVVSRQGIGTSRLGDLRVVYPSHFDDPVDVCRVHDMLATEVQQEPECA